MPKQGSSPLVWLLVMLAVVTILSFWFLFVDFQGLNHPRGMEQAAIAREVARGNGLVDKSIRPLALQATQNHRERFDEVVSLDEFPNTIHAPLNPLVQSIALSASRDSWEVDITDDAGKDRPSGIYQPDRVLAALAVLFFIASVGINFALLTRMFDQVIAGFSSLVVVCCETLWRFSQSGLPHMLMLLLFSLGCLFLYLALERSLQGHNGLLGVLAGAVCFALLCLAHWLCLWVAAGALIFVALTMRPRAIAAGVFALVLLPGLVWWMTTQSGETGKPTGIAFLAPLSEVRHGQLQDDDLIMRTYSEESQRANPKDLPARLALSTTAQAQNIFSYFGGILAAPMFFIALLQPFRRESTARFRWALLLMWLPAAIGMSFYGLHGYSGVANQIHFLFIPLMSGYGFALVAVLWNRLDIPADLPLRRTMPLIIVSLVSVLPLVLSLARGIRLVGGLRGFQDAGVPPVSVNAMRRLRDAVPADEYVFSDIPWAVAWYADRKAVWLPTDLGSTVDLLADRRDAGDQCAGITLSGQTFNLPFFSGIVSDHNSNEAYAHLVYELAISTMIDQRRKYERAEIGFLPAENMSTRKDFAPLILYTPTEELR